MTTLFYMPRQGDTASVVADGYASNFETLDTAKADAQAVSDALAGKVDKAEGKDLMTSAEREKLSGIEAGANAYTLPAATASTLGGVKAGDNVTITPDGTLSAGEYVLPKASSTVLGGIKVGRNLSIDAEGRLSAVGGSGSGGGILVLPHVAPERDADGNLTNSAAFVDAWGGILSAYLAAPDSQALYMYMDAADGMQLKVPCTLMKVDQSETTDTYYMFASQIVGMPGASTSLIPVKTLCLTALVCTKEHVLQQVPIYLVEGIMTSGGQPNLLGGDNTVFIDLSGVDLNKPEQLKAAFEPAVASMLADSSTPVFIFEPGNSTSPLPAICIKDNNSVVFWSFAVHNYVGEDPGDNLAASVNRFWCAVSGGVLQSVDYKHSSGWLTTMSMFAEMSFETLSKIEDTDKLVIGGRSSYTTPHAVTAKQFSEYVRQEIPQPRYRNLCLNSRGDNLNCWEVWSGADRIEIDTAKFGRPVIKLTNQYIGSTGEWWFGLHSKPNMPEIAPYIGTGVPLPLPLTLSCNVWCNYAVDLVAGDNNSSSVSLLPGKFQRVSHTIAAGTVMQTLGFGVGKVTQKSDLEIYYEMMQAEWGTEVTPYCYNAALPDSGDEQLVPGEIWLGTDGVQRQVYVRTLRGTTSGMQVFSVMTGIYEADLVRGYIFNVDNYKIPAGLYNGQNGADFWNYAVSPSNSLNIESIGEKLYNKPYKFTFKYTKS